MISHRDHNATATPDSSASDEARYDAQVMRVVYAVGWLMRLQILGLALSAFVLSGSWALGAACVFLALFGFFAGVQGVTFNVLMSKVIPVTQRGRLTGMRNFLGGLTASGVA